ncbi:Mitochondrial sulfhydryl oxidase involved in the biogenesis of cytosolic Fe/S proteins [Phaffia rhodozyma]|uniref:Sulfhydryl oxidase n=1 Tax=Phaffia rhodozyma TaxID=264483 RepID=A0A0F7SQH2_PHARH|nr:Mitochondrial sulfhydryl oxidase involved in the biogenesis of cytosolic Fe/S proteins [Phaffia rhodozyma]
MTTRLFNLARSTRRPIFLGLATSSALLTAYAFTGRPLLFAESASSNSVLPSSTIPGIPFQERPKLSKGSVVLDENGKPCKMCSSLKSFMNAGPKKSSTSNSDSSSSGSQTVAATAAGGVGASIVGLGVRTEEELAALRKDCPPDIEELGRSTWTFLHAMSSSLPSTVPSELQPHVTSLLMSLTHLYPCPHCRSDFVRSVRDAGGEESVREAARTREGVEKWLCERHNEVNGKLGKEPFDCAAVRERWKNGPKDGRCDLW